MKKYEDNVVKSKIKLDKIDYKILSMLEFNGRVPTSTIAKNLKKSNASVIYKMNRLKKEEVIVGSYPIINLGKLGYKYIKLYLNLENLNKDTESEIVSYFLNKENVGIIVLFRGCYDMQISFFVKDMYKLYKMINDFSLKFGNNIISKRLSIIIETNLLKKNYLYHIKSSERIIIKYEEDNNKIDEIDKKIINLLSDEGRITLLEMAKKLKLSINAVKYRKKHLESAGIIVSYMMYYNYKRLNYQRQKVFLMLNPLHKREFDELLTYLFLEPNVVHVSKAISSYDLEFDVDIRNTNEFNEFIEKLKQRFQNKIKKIDSGVIRGEYLSGYNIFQEGLIPNL